MALNNMIADSRYPVEKIVWADEGAIDSSNPHWGEGMFGEGVIFQIPEGMNYQNILLDGIWTNNNWRSAYPINTNSPILGWKRDPDSDSYSPYSDSAGCSIQPKALGSTSLQIVVSGTSDSGQQLKYRVWAYLTEDATNNYTLNKTSEQLAHSFQKNTSVAQLNIISEIVLTVGDGQTITYQHNLGFRPFCKIWWRFESQGSLLLNPWDRNGYQQLDTPNAVHNFDDKITIDEHSIKIYAKDPWGEGQRKQFLVRIFSYAIPS